MIDRHAGAPAASHSGALAFYTGNEHVRCVRPVPVTPPAVGTGPKPAGPWWRSALKKVAIVAATAAMAGFAYQQVQQWQQPPNPSTKAAQLDRKMQVRHHCTAVVSVGSISGPDVCCHCSLAVITETFAAPSAGYPTFLRLPHHVLLRRYRRSTAAWRRRAGDGSPSLSTSWSSNF